MKNLRRITSLLLMAVMVAGMLAVPGGNVQAAKKKKVQLNKKTVTLEIGKKVTLKLKNAPKKKKIRWSSNKKKIASVNKKGVVTAKKTGKTKITAKVSGKKYVCKVTVTTKTTQDNATSTTTNPTPANPTPASVLVSDLKFLREYQYYVWKVGDTGIVSVALSPANATNKNIEWTVSKAGVVRLTPNGLSADISVIGLGDTEIIAKTTDGSNKQVSFKVSSSHVNVNIKTSNPDYQYIFNSGTWHDYDYGGEDIYHGNAPWEKLRSTLSYEVPEGYTATFHDYSDPDWVYTKGYIDIKDSTGKTVDTDYIIYYVNDLHCEFVDDNDQVKCVKIDDDEDYNSIDLEGNDLWSEVDKSKIHFKCNKEDFEIVTDWDEDSVYASVGYVYICGKGESNACEKYSVCYDNPDSRITGITCKKEEYLDDYYCWHNYIDIYGYEAWSVLKDQLQYETADGLSVSYDEGDYKKDDYVAVLNVKKGDSVVRKYKIRYYDKNIEECE